MVNSHPTDDWLAAYAAGAASDLTEVAIATHLTFCEECRRSVALLEEIGGSIVFDDGNVDTTTAMAAPVSARRGADACEKELEITQSGFAQLDALAPPPLLQFIASTIGLRDFDDMPWRPCGDNVERALLAWRPGDGTAHLLRAAPGARFFRHNHSDDELSVILKGAYTDQFGRFAAGDFQVMEPGQAHQPVVDGSKDCVTLVVSDGKALPSNPILRLASELQYWRWRR